MKQSDIVKIIAVDLGTSDVAEINKLLKDPKTPIKYRISGPKLGHLGITGPIKNLAADGLKVFVTNKVNLIRYEDIVGFDKPNPRNERDNRTKKTAAAEPAVAKKSVGASAVKTAAPEFADEGNDGYDDDLRPKKFKKKAPKVAGKAGSKFIPAFKK